MNRHGIRYIYEHKVLPQWFYEDGGRFVLLLLKENAVLFDIINKIFQKENLPNPYSKDDFSVDGAQLTEDVMMVKITFPEPEEEPLCYCAYLFFDKKFERMAYYCIEKGNEAGCDLPFVCSWTSDRTHHNYGNCTLEKNDDFLKCIRLFMGDQLNEKSKKELS